MEKMKQTLAFLLACLLVISSIPIQSRAEGIHDTPVSSKVGSSNEAPPFVTDELQKGEVIGLRTENSKTYYLGNGKFTKKYYFEPIHKKVNGKWVDLSSDLTDTSNGSDATTENAILSSTFSKKMTNGQYAAFSYQGTSVSYSLVSASGESGTIQASNRHAVYKKKENKILYKNVFPGIDLRNFTFDQNIKEDLVLNSYQGYNTFMFHLKTSLLAEQQNDGSISFHKEGSDATIFTLPKPYMPDANVDEHSGDAVKLDQVTFHLTKVDDGYDLTIQADATWLKDPKRVYPVYLDPSTSITTASDAFIMSAYPNTNYSSTSAKWDSALNEYVLDVGNYDSTTGNCYAYLSQDLSPVANMQVTSATFNVY